MSDTIVYTAKSESTTISDSELRLSTVTVTYVATWQLDVKVTVGVTPRDVTFPFSVTAMWQVTLSGSQPSSVLVS